MSTRETIINALKLRGGSRADDLAGPLGLTPMAVRQHLYQLQEEGAVTCESKALGRGRPAKLWQLTSKSDVYFVDAHRDLSLDLIDSIKATLGEKGLEAIIDHRSEKQLAHYKTTLDSTETLAERLHLLAAARSDEGYMADAKQNPDGSFILYEHHCPICEAAKVCSGLCKKELEVFQAALGENVIVARDEHILAGARRCSYTIKQKS